MKKTKRNIMRRFRGTGVPWKFRVKFAARVARDGGIRFDDLVDLAAANGGRVQCIGDLLPGCPCCGNHFWSGGVVVRFPSGGIRLDDSGGLLSTFDRL